MDNLGLPTPEELEAILDLRWGGGVNDLVAKSLLNPLGEFLSRPGKRLRAKFVSIGYALAGKPRHNEWAMEICEKASNVVEFLHAGSLVVDDIQDESLTRRGVPTLHLSHGIPLALNAGNWLYFWPFEQIRSWRLDSRLELGMYRLFHETLLRAHFGQALDVGTRVDELEQERVLEVCLASLELKTGALMALGIGMGGILGEASDSRLSELKRFGHAFGVALQMYDDIGNFAKPNAKRFEDLKWKRPGWLWAVAASTFSPAVFQELIDAVDLLPDDSALQVWCREQDLVARAKRQAKEYLHRSLETLTAAVAGDGDYTEPLARLGRLGEKLEQAYE